MTDWQVFFLGVMAVALVAMAAAQVFIGFAVLKATKQVTDAVDSVRRDVGPLIQQATRLTDDAARVTALAVTQAERLDTLVTSIAGRIDETVGLVQGAVNGPIRQGVAVVAGIRAMLSAFRDLRSQSASARDDEDAMFVG